MKSIGAQNHNKYRARGAAAISISGHPTQKMSKFDLDVWPSHVHIRKIGLHFARATTSLSISWHLAHELSKFDLNAWPSHAHTCEIGLKFARVNAALSISWHLAQEPSKFDLDVQPSRAHTGKIEHRFARATADSSSSWRLACVVVKRSILRISFHVVQETSNFDLDVEGFTWAHRQDRALLRKGHCRCGHL